MFIGYKTSTLCGSTFLLISIFVDEMGSFYQKPNDRITPERKRRRRKLNNVTVD